MTERTKSHGRLTASANLKPRDLMAERGADPGAWTAEVITLFPETFPGVLGASLTGKALDKGLWRLKSIDLRLYGDGKHRNVDDTPAGGGAGMVLRADVMAKAISQTTAARRPRGRWPLVYLSPRGRPFDQSRAANLAKAEGMTLICGRFEGLDQRVIDAFDIEEISLGDFVLSGGEIAAQAVLDATVRLIPGVLGNAASTVDESFSDGLLEHPQYTRPATWQGLEIPPVLTSGDHGEIAKWRRIEAETLTQNVRPDLWEKYTARKK